MKRDRFSSAYFAGPLGLGDPLDSESRRPYASSKPSRVCAGNAGFFSRLGFEEGFEGEPGGWSCSKVLRSSGVSDEKKTFSLTREARSSLAKLKTFDGIGTGNGQRRSGLTP